MFGIRTYQSLAALLATGSMTLSACGTAEDASAEGGACSATIAVIGATTGDYANLGLNIVGGAEVALHEYDQRGVDCAVELKRFDSQGDPEKATPLAAEIISDQSIIAVVGPAFSGETDATGAAFNEARLATISPSATNPDLVKNGWTTFHRLLGNDVTQADAASRYISENLDAVRPFVIDDASEYGKGLADGVAAALGDSVVGTDTVQQKQTDFSATVTKVVSAGADALFYGGYYPEFGLLTKQLRAAGWDGHVVSGDGSLDAGYIEAAGVRAAEGGRVTCPCAPAEGTFLEDYKRVNDGRAPGTYSAEGYDAATVILNGIAEGKTSRDEMLAWIDSYDEDGLTKHIKFDEVGEVSDIVIYAYVVEDGELVLDTPVD